MAHVRRPTLPTPPFNPSIPPNRLLATYKLHAEAARHRERRPCACVQRTSQTQGQEERQRTGAYAALEWWWWSKDPRRRAEVGEDYEDEEQQASGAGSAVAVEVEAEALEGVDEEPQPQPHPQPQPQPQPEQFTLEEAEFVWRLARMRTCGGAHVEDLRAWLPGRSGAGIRRLWNTFLQRGGIPDVYSKMKYLEGTLGWVGRTLEEKKEEVRVLGRRWRRERRRFLRAWVRRAMQARGLEVEGMYWADDGKKEEDGARPFAEGGKVKRRRDDEEDEQEETKGQKRMKIRGKPLAGYGVDISLQDGKETEEAQVAEDEQEAEGDEMEKEIEEEDTSSLSAQYGNCGEERDRWTGEDSGPHQFKEVQREYEELLTDMWSILSQVAQIKRPAEDEALSEDEDEKSSEVEDEAAWTPLECLEVKVDWTRIKDFTFWYKTKPNDEGDSDSDQDMDDGASDASAEPEMTRDLSSEQTPALPPKKAPQNSKRKRGKEEEGDEDRPQQKRRKPAENRKKAPIKKSTASKTRTTSRKGAAKKKKADAS